MTILSETDKSQANRLDVALVQRGLFSSRAKAAAAVAAGKVQVAGAVTTKVATLVTANSQITVSAPDHYVSRAAHKLLAALDESGIEVPTRVLDAGASTGGFTQVLLERGAERVYAVDVGHGQLAEMLRNDPKVTEHEGFNLRDLSLDQLESQPVELIVADVSFISLKLLLKPLLAVLAPDGIALLLVKPQFEVGRGGLNSQGVVTDEGTRCRVVNEVIEHAVSLGAECIWRGRSALVGASGNVEYFIALTVGTPAADCPSV
ncbi:MAG: TlyA family RNA methyltransferase [Propionibacteriaceae bacterium]|nr:TlyA family RNA methyltransferase [Propionibacteriaceae bacterium]